MWRLTSGLRDRLGTGLNTLYPQDNVERLLERISLVASRYSFLEECFCRERAVMDEKSCLLITYGDMIAQEDEQPLQTLQRFLTDYCADLIPWVHILPFFPYSSDDGFSVIDYRVVDRELGDWEDVERIGKNFCLMFDLVLNHVSRRSRWFQDYLASIAPARNYFLEVDPDGDYSQVVRPRTSPLLTKVETVAGTRSVWTTFSDDQIDLNYANFDLLLEIIDILLGYISHGAKIIRLDAIAYLWKQEGSTCINLPQTHEVVKLLRAMVDYVAPGMLILTETNLPHEQNVSYFGDGDEAHMVYQFSLPPLLLHALHKGSAAHLRAWARDLSPPPEGCAYLNFTASHDGIGVRPLEGLLPREEIDGLVEIIRSCGGLVSSRVAEDGREVPYELNITYFDALQDPARPDDEQAHMARFLCSQAIMLSLSGVPAIYFHSLTAGRNNYVDAGDTNRNRLINRGRPRDAELRAQLEDPASITSRVFHHYGELLRKRGSHPAFHPRAAQRVADLPDSLFGVVRVTPDNNGGVVCLFNMTGEEQIVGLSRLEPYVGAHAEFHDLVGERPVRESVCLEPYGYCWLVFG